MAGFRLEPLNMAVSVVLNGEITTFSGVIPITNQAFPQPGQPAFVYPANSQNIQLKGTATVAGEGDREFTVTCRSPKVTTTTTTMQYSSGGTIGQGASVPIGSTVQDQITISNLPPVDIEGDSVDYRLHYSATGYACPSGGIVLQDFGVEVTQTGTAVLTTGSYVAALPGFYSWVVTYNGVSPFTIGSQSVCGAEKFFVPKGDPTITTQTDASGTIRSGDTVTDSITVTTPAGYPAASGNATVEVVGPNGYSGSVQSTATAPLTGSGPATASYAYTVPASLDGGTYCFRVSLVATTLLNAKTHTNSTTECFTVGKPGLTITKLTGAGNTNQTVSFGDGAISYTIKVTSSGTVDAQNVTVSDTLPTGVTWTTTSPDCAIAAGVLTCSFGTVAAGQNRTATVTSATTSPACGVYTNVASVTATTITTPKTATATITVACSKVTIAKTPDQTSGGTGITAPATAEFTILVTVADAKALNVTVTDTLPSGTWTTATEGCSIADGTLSCSFGTPDAGATRTIKVSRATTSADCGLINNTAQVSSGPTGTTPVTASDTGAINIVCAPNLTIAKTVSADEIGPNGTTMFTVTVTNDGTQDSPNTTVTDKLPNVPGGTWTYVSGCATAPTLTNGGTFTCNVGTVAKDGGTKSFSVQLAIGAMPDVSACGNRYSNRATLSGATGSPATARVTVLCATVGLTKTVDKPTIAPGETATFTVRMSVTGATTAQELSFTDALPNIPGATWATAGDFGCSPAPAGGATVTCTFTGAVAPNGSKTQTFTVTAPSAANIASADCNKVFTNSASTRNVTPAMTKTATVTIACANVSVDKSASPATVTADGTTAFTIVVSNANGGAAATAVTLQDIVPNTLTVLPNTLSQTGAATTTLGFTGNTLNGTWASLAAGASTTITFQATAKEDTCGPVENTATVAAGNEPAAVSGSGNTDSATVTVNCASTLAIAKSASTDTVGAGGVVTYTVTVTNSGSAIAPNVSVSDALPDITGATWAIAGCANNPTGVSGATFTCELGDIARRTGGVDGTASFTVTLTAPATIASADCGTKTNVATITGSQISASADITVQCPDVSVVKTNTSGTVLAGGSVVFTVVVANNGTGTATNVVVSDTLPAGLTLVSATSTVGTPVVSIPNGTVTLTLASLDAAESATITITATATAAACPSVTNTATVIAGNEPASRTGDNSSSATVAVTCTPTVTTQVGGAGPLQAGDAISDTATLAGVQGGATPTGTVTFALYGPNATRAYGSAVVSTSDATLVDGAATFTGTAPAAAGWHCFAVSYGGDTTYKPVANHRDAATECFEVAAPVISITKTVPEGQANPISAGEAISYRIVATNSATVPARGITIGDTLPNTGGTWSATFSGVGTLTCSVALNVVSCTGDLGAGQSVTIDVTSPTTSLIYCASYDNTATISRADSVLASADASIDVECSDVSVAKTVGDGEETVTVDPGDAVSYTFTVTNAGPGTATNVTMTDTLPAGFVYDSFTADEGVICDDSASPFSCTVASLAANASATVVITGTAGPVCSFENAASVSAANEASDAKGNDTSRTVVVTVNCGDLGVSKTAGAGTYSAGAPVSFTVTVTNAGPGPARSASDGAVVVSDTLPTTYGITGWTITGGNEAGTCAIDANVLSCTLPGGELAADASFSVTVTSTATTAGSASCGGVVSNTAEIDVDAVIGERNAENNSATATTTLTCVDISVTKTASAESVTAGDTITYTVTVTNNGPGTAYGVETVDTLPAGVTLVPADTTVGYTEDGGTLTWTLASLEPGSQTYTVTVLTSAASCGRVTNSVAVSADNEATDDPPVLSSTAGLPVQVDDNAASVTTSVVCADVSVEKTGNGPIAAGTDAVFTIVVSNDSDVEARDVVLTDVEVGGYTLGGADAGDCAITDGTLSCTFATIEASGTRTVTLTRSTGFDDCDTITNTVSLTVVNMTTPPADGTATIDVTCADVEVVKEVDATVVSAGDTITYTVTVSNTGDGPATNVTVSDTLPANTTLVSAEGDPANVEGTLTWTIPTLAADGSIAYEVVVQTSAVTCGDVTNQASTAADNDSDPANNDSEIVTTTVDCPKIEIGKTGTETVNAPGQIVYTVTVRNTGAGEAKDVTVSDALPAGTGFVSAEGNPSNGDGTLTWTVASLASEASVSYRVVVSVGVQTCGTVTNTARAWAGNDPVATAGSPLTASVDTAMTCADMTIEKVANAESVRSGDTITYTITVRNIGNGTAEQVVFDDVLPANLTLISATGEPELRDGNPTWTIPSLGAGESFSVTVVVLTVAGNCDAVVNHANVAADNDSATGNNDATARTTVTNCGHSDRPSSSPSSHPSDPDSSPSTDPSSSPSSRPSDPASDAPSASPSVSPSSDPSEPASSPSDAPSDAPSSDPSRPSTSRAASPSSVPVTGLPDTGSGPTETSAISLSLLMLIVALIAVTAVAIGRQRPGRTGGAAVGRRTIRR